MKATIEGVNYDVRPCLLKSEDREWYVTGLFAEIEGERYSISQANDGLCEIVAVGSNVYQLDIAD